MPPPVSERSSSNDDAGTHD